LLRLAIMTRISTQLGAVRARIHAACRAAGRPPEAVALLAVSKTFGVAAVQAAFDAGQTAFGENYIQEALEKYETLADFGLVWHFIGHLQTNKARFAVKMFDLIHTVGSLRLAAELNRQAEKVSKNQDILIQVNIARERSKSGVDPDDAPELVRQISQFSHLSIRGLMAIPPFFDDSERVRPYFAALRSLRDYIRNQHIKNVDMHELSMGMTGDFEVAISEGATLVRIGTAIFGERA
jgi:pyridoxal phosphate enzyme (YggS family)